MYSHLNHACTYTHTHTRAHAQEQLQLVFTCMITVLKAGFRERHKALDLKSDLEKLNFPSYCVEAFVKVFKKKRKKIEKTALKSSIRYPTLKCANWRVDVTVSTSSLSRVLKPSVLMQLTLSDGTIKTFEMQVDQFHQLRYNVAKVLQYMRKIENRAIMSLVADLEIGKLKHS
jgi:COMM domain containing 5